MNKSAAVVAIYDSRSEAEAGVHDLQQSGFDKKNLSIVDKHYHAEKPVVGFYKPGDRSKAWGKLGAFWSLFFSIGIPESSILQYEAEINADKFLVLAHGIASEVAKAKSVLATNKAARIAEHQQLLAG